MNQFVKRVKTKLKNTSRLRLLTVLGVVATASILVAGSANAYSHYKHQKQLAKSPRAAQQVAKKTTPNKPQATASPSKKTSKLANNSTVKNDLKNCLQTRTEIVPREKAMADEQKRHLDKLKVIQTNLQKSGNANPEGYKQELAKENDLNRQNIQGIMKPQAKNTNPQGC